MNMHAVWIKLFKIEEKEVSNKVKNQMKMIEYLKQKFFV